jgi:transketolase
MTGFGASAPYKDLYKHFGITAEAVVAAAVDVLGRERTAAGLKSARRS